MLSIVLIQDPHTGTVTVDLTDATREELERVLKHNAASGKVPKITSFTPLELEGPARRWILRLYATAETETDVSLGLKALLTLTLTMIANGSLDVSHMGKEKKKRGKRGEAKAE